MTAFFVIQALLVLIVAGTLAAIVHAALKAGGSVEITLPSIKVKWGTRK